MDPWATQNAALTIELSQEISLEIPNWPS
jgi:hypothetical protein